MKKKINLYYLIIASVAIVITLVLTVTVFYEQYKKEVLDNLECAAHILQESGTFDDVQNEKVDFAPEIKNMRITVIDSNGQVLYDSIVDAETLDNHIDRPEVQEALNSGIGKTVRKSSTMKKSNFYIAVKLNNDKVLRVSKETDSIWSIFYNALPFVLVLGMLLFVLCMFVTHFLTISLVRPIEQMANDLDNIDKVAVYKELMPFITLIKQQHEDILKSAKIRQEFTANVSHELKTPLTSISGYSELIENGMASENDTRRFAGEIHSNSKRLLTLINDILKLSELDCTENEIIKEDVDLYEIAQNCVNMLDIHAKKHGITLKCYGNECIVKGNKDMMEELMYNLCDNAIRYNISGGYVHITTRINNDNQGTIIVEDNGIGISKKNQQRIFERFYRVDKSRSKKTGGTGLGLAIVKHIVEKHDALIGLESEEGKGTKITIVIPKKN